MTVILVYKQIPSISFENKITIKLFFYKLYMWLNWLGNSVDGEIVAVMWQVVEEVLWQDPARGN